VTVRRQLERRSKEALDALLAMAEALVQIPSATDDAVASTPGASPLRGRSARDATAARLVELTRRVLGCGRLGIVRVDLATGRQSPVAVVGLPAEQVPQWWVETEQAPFADIPEFAFSGRLVAGEVLVIDMRQPPFSEPPLSELPNPYGVRSILVAPLRVGERLIGILSYDYGTAEHEFSRQEIALAEGVAKLAALVLERERLLCEREEGRADMLALRGANRRMDEFLGIVAHELRTPLTTILASIQMAERQIQHVQQSEAEDMPAAEVAALTARLANLLTRSDRQAGRLARLVSDLLDISRVQAGRLELRQVPSALAPFGEEAVEEQRAAHPARAITFAAPASLADVRVLLDPDRIGQVVTNYLTNAIRYAPPDRPITVRLERDGDAVRVAVRDEGPGLSDAEQTLVWDRFYRGLEAQAMGSAWAGLGLGLYICKTIVERHGGQLGIQSAPGKGSSFWFTLPLSAGSRAGC
jgi:signal transduction histidine kinase